MPAFANLINWWLATSIDVRDWVLLARLHPGPVYLRDFDTGRGVDRHGPMSHAWVIATWLNTGGWPTT